MACNKCLSLNCFGTQYSLIFVSLFILAKLSCCIGCLLSNVGLLFVVGVLSWRLTKKFRKCRNKELVTSFKKAVLVTGCDSGFGNATAHKLNENGFRVYATVLNPESDGAKDLATGGRFQGKTKVIKMDVTNEDEIKAVYEEVKSDLQRNGEELWAVVNNAGILTLGPIDWGTTDAFRNLFEVNTLGTVRVTRTFLPLIRQSKGRIVNLVSMAGRFAATNMGHYCMSKHASIAFSDAVRRENSKHGVKVITVEPMAYRTAMTTEDACDRLYDKQWNESSQEVRDFYGEDFFKNLKALKAKGHVLFPPSEKTYEVVDTVIKATRSSDPEIRYPVIPCEFGPQIFFTLASWLPTEVTDLFAKLSQKRRH